MGKLTFDKDGNAYNFYQQVSFSKKDSDILNDLTIWVFGNETNKDIPHYHIISEDGFINIEISIIDGSVINSMQVNYTEEIKEKVDKWLNRNNSRALVCTNKEVIFASWDWCNPNNELLYYVDNNHLEIKDECLLKFLKRQKNE